ncbi:MAG: VTT domain-containing protein [Actinomycetota bacterium]|nr:VTT domain-containing protein [Actinomycetota bacterium]
MGDLLSLLGIAFASALVPIFNVEAYLGVRAAFSDETDAWLLGLVAALGQMVGKTIWYYLGASSLHWGWVRRKMEKPKQQARLKKWRTRTDERPVLAGALTFWSAFTGFPPFAILSVLAGQLKMNYALFLTLGLAGRWLRFASILGGVDWLHRLG